MPYIYGRRRKSRTHRPPPDANLQSIPKSLVVRRGRLTPSAKQLVQDLRQLMSPWCATQLKESRHNKLLDFIKTSKIYGFSHLQMISQTDMGMYLKIARLPHGPTVTFQILNFSLSKDIRLYQKRPRSDLLDFKASPLVVLHGFHSNTRTKQNGQSPSQQNHRAKHPEKVVDSQTGGVPYELLVATLNGLFPAIDPNHIKLSQCRRALLYSYSESKNVIELRQFAIIKRPAGITRGIKKLLKTKASKAINLAESNDVSEFVASGGAGCASDSEMEDITEFVVPKNATKEAYADTTQKIGISLLELGPRLTLRLLKVEEEVCDGSVLYHGYIKKTAKELEVLESKVPTLKAKRRERKRSYEKELALRLEEISTTEPSKSRKRSLKANEYTLENSNETEDNLNVTNGAGERKKAKYNPFSFKKVKKSSSPFAGGSAFKGKFRSAASRKGEKLKSNNSVLNKYRKVMTSDKISKPNRARVHRSTKGIKSRAVA